MMWIMLTILILITLFVLEQYYRERRKWGENP